MKGPVLVTGAQGFVGRWTVARALRESVALVVGLGRSPRSETFTHHVSLATSRVRAPLPPELAIDEQRYTYLSVDIRDVADLASVLRRVRPSVVIHLASALRDEPLEHLTSLNVEGTFALVQAIARSGITLERLIVASSSSVYGAAVRLPISESDAPAPADLYAVSKLAAEHVGAIETANHAIPLIVARIFNVVGPGLDERHACARFASQFAALSLGRTSDPVVVGDLSPTRDFVDVRDVADALLLLADRGVAGTTYNIASGRETAMRTVFRTLASLAGCPPTAVDGYLRSGDTKRVVADISRLTRLGWAPCYPLPDSLAELFRCYVGPVACAVTSLESTAPVNACATSGLGTQG